MRTKVIILSLSICILICLNANIFAQMRNYNVKINVLENTAVYNKGGLNNEVNGVVTINGFYTSEGNINNSGTINIENSGSFIDNGVITSSGSFNVKKDINKEVSHYFASPVVNAMSNVFAGNYVNKFEEPTSNWIPIVQNELLTAMCGYSVLSLQEKTLSFNGKVYTANQSITLSKQASGWNLVGNSYPSAVNWDATGWTKTNVDNSIYLWNGTNYAVYNGTTQQGTNGATKYIPSLQGYFVRCNSTSGTLLSENIVRTHNNTMFYKNDPKAEINKISLKINNTQYQDETIILFTENATNSLDAEYDAIKLLSHFDGTPQIYSLSSENDKLAINSLNHFNEEFVIPLSIKNNNNDELTISLSEISLNFKTPIFLVDKKLNSFVDLAINSNYSFYHNQNDAENRFEIRFSEQTNMNETDMEYTKVYADKNNIIIANQNYKCAEFDVTVYNMLGIEVIKQTLTSNYNQIAVPNANGIYIVELKQQNNIVTKKVFLHE